MLTSAENPLSGILAEVYAGSGPCDRFCSKISVLTGPRCQDSCHLY